MKFSSAGFTLIEILIVIAIVSLLATIGIGAYGRARQNLVLDLETEKIVNLLHSLRENSKSGHKCSDITFKINDTPKKTEMPFKKAIQGCEEKNFNGTPIAWAQEMKLKEILLDGNSKDYVTIRFLPPHGKIIFNPNGERIEFTLSISSTPHLLRKILVEKETGRIEKK